MSTATDRLLSKKWGVFNHYLNGMQNGKLKYRNPSGKITDWNAFIEEFDTEKLAYNLHLMKAGYYTITIMQASKYMCAPNETYNKLTGCKPGEACSFRDLPADLYNSLSKYDIDLYLYISADGPWMADDIGDKLSIGNPRNQVTHDFVENWSSVMKEYAERYGNRIKGWWIDSCYKRLGFDDELLEYYHKAAKSGNPEAIVACNVGGIEGFIKGLSTEEFICGERNDFDIIPESRYIDGAQSHILAPLGEFPKDETFLGGAWCFPGTKRTKEYMLDYISRANAVGTPVSVDIVVYRDGSFDKEQQELLTYVGNSL